MDESSPHEHPQKPEKPEQDSLFADRVQPPSITSSTSTLTDIVPASDASASVTSATKQSPSNPLEQELADLKTTLSDVGASFGGWWGKVQKQSVNALNASALGTQLTNARKDLAALNLLDKAKKEVEKLSEKATAGYAAVQSELEQGPDPSQSSDRVINVDGLELVLPSDPSGSGSPKGKERASEPTSANATLPIFDSSAITSFFSKLSKDSEKYTVSLQSALSQLPATANLSEVQKLAEGYLAKGEVYLQDVGKELRELAQEAVKVIPPTEEQPTADHPPQSAIQTHLSRRDSKREVSISRLGRNSSSLLLDPTTDETSSPNAFSEFCAAMEAAGGIGGEAWQKKIAERMTPENPDSVALKATYDKIVPSELSAEVFWTRYFFRMHQIEQEEAARRLVLGAAHKAHEGDFSWDLEDESGSEDAGKAADGAPTVQLKTEDQCRSATPKFSDLCVPSATAAEEEDDWGNSPAVATSDTPQARTTAPKAAPKSGSGRNSSEGTTESFDVISAQVSVDENRVKEKQKVKEEEEDSDWE